MKQAFFITGTDTGAGKTLIASALVYHYARQGFNSLGMKPVAAGCELKNGRLMSEDASQLIAASNVDAEVDLINPYAFSAAIAPHIAAAADGMAIELPVILQAYAQLASQADVVIVEGVGGFCVPLGDAFDTADLAQQLGLPVILVVGIRLGCLNHALLTVEAIERRGLKLAGWVANQPEPQMAAPAENLQALKQRIAAPCIAVVPLLEQPDFKLAARYIQLD